MLDARTEKAIKEVAETVRGLFGRDLVCVALYGSAAGDDFVPGRSDLNFAIVVERLTFTHLKALHAHLPGWHKRGVATPLLLDRRWLQRSRDVFPMEFHDLQAQHRMLYGEEVFATLAIDSRHLRYQAEREARGKLLRLRALYAEVGADRARLEALMLDSVKTFLIIMRNLTRLRGAGAHAPYVQVLDQFESHVGIAFPTMRHLLQIKLETQRWSDGIDATFSSYLDEVERLVDLVDRVGPDAEAAAP